MKDNVVTRTALRYAVKEVIKDPDRRLPRALRLVRAFDQKGVNRKTYDALEVALEDSENNWNRYLHNIFSQIAPDILEKLTSSLLVNAAIASSSLRTENMNRYQCNVPWAILMDPTAACNLQCTGCWAAEYGKQTSLSYDTLDRIIREGKALGVYVYIFSGGEPLLRRADLIRLAEAHGDCVFLAFTNGTLVDKDFTKQLRQVGNFALAFSIEGFEEETDLRRGKGTYKAVIAAMELLRQEGVVFGFSTCYHRKNVDCVGSDAYVDFLINEGCLFGWYFTYIPIGAEAVPDLIATPDQRAFMYGKMRAWRQNKPCFLLDFWNDGEYVGGCIAGGRNYLHINANGDVEPCAFIHYSNVNIHSVSLLEALRSPLFMEYRRNQPFNGNLLRPCPLLDNPEKLRIMVARSGAHSTEMESPEDVGTLTAKTQGAAEAWAPVAEQLWNNLKHG